jgi:S-formylglutathione hydrolase FrmB
VLYVLHGYQGVKEHWTHGFQGLELDRSMDSLIAAGKSREMIVVAPNGRNGYFGSFYLDSPVTGGWETWLTRDLVAYVDSAYRTIKDPAGRGIAGHSMGGFGALTLAMRHPDVYGAAYGLSPCCLGLLGDITASNPAWRKALAVRSRSQLEADPQSYESFWVDAIVALSAAVSPDPARKPLFVDFPYRMVDGKLVPDPATMARWRRTMPLHAVDRYTGNLRRLRAIGFDYGEKEEFSHIRLSASALSAALAARGIPHQFEVYPKGNHGDRIRARFEGTVIPFFSRVFAEP